VTLAEDTVFPLIEAGSHIQAGSLIEGRIHCRTARPARYFALQY